MNIFALGKNDFYYTVGEGFSLPPIWTRTELRACVPALSVHEAMTLGSPSPEERGKVSALLTDEGWTSARELSLTSVKLEMTEHIILLILSFTGARDLICLVLSQVATLIRRPAGATFPQSMGEGLI